MVNSNCRSLLTKSPACIQHRSGDDRWLQAGVLLCAVLHTMVLSADVANSRALSFERNVVPILQRHCLKCHGEEDRHGNLDLRRRFRMVTGGDSGPALVPKDPAGSLLIQYIDDGLMPPKQQPPVSESDSLPAYVVLPDPPGALEAGQLMYMNGFLPASCQPTMLRPGERPVLNLELPPHVKPEQRARTLQLIQQLNTTSANSTDAELQARISAYEIASRMHQSAPDVFDLTRESRETLELYGVGSQPTDDYGRRCLLARRMVEGGERFLCVASGGGPGNMQWDAHADIEEKYLRKARETDQPVAALMRDLKRRDLLDETLVLWGGEFGRSPEAKVGITKTWDSPC